MSNTSSKLFKSRTTKASSIAEFGPVLWLLLLCVFLPLLLVLAMACQCGALYLLNKSQLQEASLSRYKDALDPNGAVRKQIPEDWMKGVGKFANLAGVPNTVVMYKLGPPDANRERDHFVIVTTTASINPILSVPFPNKITGLNAPSTFSFSSERLVENKDYAPPDH